MSSHPPPSAQPFPFPASTVLGEGGPCVWVIMSKHGQQRKQPAAQDRTMDVVQQTLSMASVALGQAQHRPQSDGDNLLLHGAWARGAVSSALSRGSPFKDAQPTHAGERPLSLSLMFPAKLPPTAIHTQFIALLKLTGDPWPMTGCTDVRSFFKHQKSRCFEGKYHPMQLLQLGISPESQLMRSSPPDVPNGNADARVLFEQDEVLIAVNHVHSPLTLDLSAAWNREQ